MRYKIQWRMICVYVLIWILMLPDPKIFATETEDTEKVSLTILYKDHEIPLEGAYFDIHRAAEWSESQDAYVLTDEFSEFPVDAEDINEETIRNLAVTLEAYVYLNDIPPIESGYTDEEGKLVFKDLEPGLYLVTGANHTQNHKVYVTEPFLILLPMKDDLTGEVIYDVVANPKYDSVPQEETTSIDVIKIWEDKGLEEKRPESIEVHLLRDGEIYDTVKLDKSNNWRWNWSELESDHIWTIAEEVPEGYFVNITRNGETYVCKNRPSEPPDTPPDTPQEFLPQTGQLWWPVPVMLILGVILILIGCICRYRGGRYEA